MIFFQIEVFFAMMYKYSICMTYDFMQSNANSKIELSSDSNNIIMTFENVGPKLSQACRCYFHKF